MSDLDERLRALATPTERPFAPPDVLRRRAAERGRRRRRVTAVAIPLAIVAMIGALALAATTPSPGPSRVKAGPGPSPAPSTTTTHRGPTGPSTYRGVAMLLLPRGGVHDGDSVGVHVTGVHPGKTFFLSVCGSNGAPCDEIESPSARASTSGVIDTRITVRAAIYGWQGRRDCTISPCSVAIRDELDVEVIEAPVRFAPGVVAPVPRLRLDPSGPHRNGQTVRVVGTGFPAGFDVAPWLGICPAGKAPETEAPCTYQNLGRRVLVDRNGRFTTTFRAYEGRTSAGPCGSAAGCVFSWILNHGPAGASVPLEFDP